MILYNIIYNSYYIISITSKKENILHKDVIQLLSNLKLAAIHTQPTDSTTDEDFDQDSEHYSKFICRSIFCLSIKELKVKN
jgi:hypothetical protein